MCCGQAERTSTAKMLDCPAESSSVKPYACTQRDDLHVTLCGYSSVLDACNMVSSLGASKLRMRPQSWRGSRPAAERRSLRWCWQRSLKK